MNPDITNFEVLIEEDMEHNICVPKIQMTIHGVAHEYLLDRDFVSSSEYSKFEEQDGKPPHPRHCNLSSPN